MKLIFAFVLLVMLFVSPQVRAQLQGTTLGKPQNDERDLYNSLIPGEKKYGGKHEKKEEVNAAELKSKSINNSTFGGNMLSLGIDPSEPKLDESKMRRMGAATSSTESSEATEAKPAKTKATEKQPAEPEKKSSLGDGGSPFSSLSQTAPLAEQLHEARGASATRESNSENPSATGTSSSEKKEENPSASASPSEKSDH